MTRSPEQIAARWLPLCFVIACQGETTTPTNVSGPVGEVAALVTDTVVASLAVIPDSQMVFAGDRFQVTARPKNKAGQVLERSVTWTVSNTSVVTALAPLGTTTTFKALRVGKTSVKATVDGKSRYAKVVVRGVDGAKVVVTPAEATVASGATVGFVATGLTKAGETAGVNVTWTATGGAISPSGDLTAGNAAGTYRVIATSAFGAADTSIVTITGTPDPPDPVAAVILVPETASLTAGETLQFDAYGRTGAGDSVPVTVSYTATGGTIAGGGLYTAGSAAGTYRVVATSAADLADTAEVTIAEAAIARVTLLPDIAASRAGETTRFVASVWNTLDDLVPEPVTYQTTCGTVSGAGVFTAPLEHTGTCLVTASAEGIADTTEVVLLTDTPGQGIPLGVNDLWTSPTTRAPGTAPFTASRQYFPPADMVNHIQAARARGVRLLLVMTGGSHDRYKTDGVFDLAKWEAAMNAFDTPAIRDAVAEGVADGTIIGNSVMDEPQQSGTTAKAWGPPGTMTKVRVDGLCAYVKAIFPTLPAGVGHDHSAFQPDSSYRVCDFFMDQYAARKGDIRAWRDAGLALAARDGMAVIFSLNLLDGGLQDKTGAWDCPGTGGVGTHSPNCRMTPEQLRDWGKVIGPAGCAMLSWRYDGAFMGKPENQAALSDVAITLSTLPRTPCRGTR
jgi:hypothetical protein